jgi:hypothetical protein
MYTNIKKRKRGKREKESKSEMKIEDFIIQASNVPPPKRFKELPKTSFYQPDKKPNTVPKYKKLPKTSMSNNTDNTDKKPNIKRKYFGIELLTWSGNGKKYRARIRVNNKIQNLGTYDTAHEAACHYDQAAIQAGRTLSKLNFPERAPKGYHPQQKLCHLNTSGYRGVAQDKRKGESIAAVININGVHTFIGSYHSLKDAAIAYDLAVLNHGLAREL